MDAALTAVGASAESGPGLASFGAFSGGRSGYDAGSHVDADGFSLLAGLAWGNECVWAA